MPTVSAAHATTKGSLLVSSLSFAPSMNDSLNASNAGAFLCLGLYCLFVSGSITSIIGLYPSSAYRSLKSVGLLLTSLNTGYTISASALHAAFSAAFIPVFTFLYWSLSAHIMIFAKGCILRTAEATLGKLPLSSATNTHNCVASFNVAPVAQPSQIRMLSVMSPITLYTPDF